MGQNSEQPRASTPNTNSPKMAAVALKAANGSAAAMQVWRPKKQYENLSFLPELTDDEIMKQIDYMTSNGMTPCLEFEPDSALGYIDRSFTSGASGTPGYYDNRYWLMWKLPMYGCTDSSEVIKEIAACKAEYPNAMIKCIGFDASRQMQVAGFLVQK